MAESDRRRSEYALTAFRVKAVWGTAALWLRPGDVIVDGAEKQPHEWFYAGSTGGWRALREDGPCPY